MRTVVVSFYKTFPPVCGAATVSYNVTKYLSGAKYLIQLSDNKDTDEINKSINLINIRYISNNRLLKAINLAIQFPNIIAKLRKISPEVIILEGASWSLYYIIFLHLLKINKINAKIIYHAHNVEYLLRKQINNRIIAIITRWAEGLLLEKSDLSFSVSSEDSIAFGKIYGIKPLVLPNGVDIDRFVKVADSQIHNIRKKYTLRGKIILFMGLPSFKPNEEAISFLIGDVFPFIVKEIPNAKLAIIGGKIKYKYEWLINPGNIPFAEVPAFIKACDVCVAPIFSGSGTRLKILEYMAAEKPIVSTTKGTEGITVRSEENIMIADDVDKFVENILYLLRDANIAKRIGYGGMKVVRANYSWEKIMQDFSENYIIGSDRQELRDSQGKSDEPTRLD